MENSTLRDCLSYDSTLNYFLWSSNVDSLKNLVSEILKNTVIASAEVNEDKHHKMLSFKAADCTIKLYTTTKKIIIQGSGSASLTLAFSDFLNVKDNGDKAMNSNNGSQQHEASARTIFATDLLGKSQKILYICSKTYRRIPQLV